MQQRPSLPVALNLFVGVCYMKTQQIKGVLPTTQSAFKAALTWHHVWKPMFGVEIPISSIAGKFGGKSGEGGKG